MTLARSKIRFHGKLNIFICPDCVYFRPSSMSDYVSMAANCWSAVLAWILCPEDMEARNWYDCHLLLPINRSEPIRFNFYCTHAIVCPSLLSSLSPLCLLITRQLSEAAHANEANRFDSVQIRVHAYSNRTTIRITFTSGWSLYYRPHHCHKLHCLGRFCGLFIGVSFYFHCSDL